MGEDGKFPRGELSRVLCSRLKIAGEVRKNKWAEVRLRCRWPPFLATSWCGPSSGKVTAGWHIPQGLRGSRRSGNFVKCWSISPLYVKSSVSRPRFSSADAYVSKRSRGLRSKEAQDKKVTA